MQKIGRDYQQIVGGGEADFVVKTSDFASLGRFADRDDPYDALVVMSYPDLHAESRLAIRFPPETPQPRNLFIGQRKLVIVVHPRNRVESIMLEQLGKILAESDQEIRWDVLGGGNLPLTIYDEGPNTWGREVLREKCMAYREERPGYTLHNFHRFRGDIRSHRDGDAVIEQVRGDPSGIGLFLYRGQDLGGVKLLSIAEAEDTEPVALSERPHIQHDYPLSEPLMLYVHPQAPESVWDFALFCVSPAGAEIAAQHGVITPHHEWAQIADQRLEDARAGRGPRVQAMSEVAMRALVPDLGSEFVRARETMQLSLHTMDFDIPAIGAFVADHPGWPELLFLTGRPSDRAFEMHGERWNELQPTEHLLAGRATAIIVNAANQLDSLTLGQIEAIFAGDVDDWAIVAPGSVAPGSAPAQRQGPNLIPINRFGLRRNDPAAILFHRERMADQLGRITVLPSTEEVVAAVSIDPQAIGFVDLAAIPEAGQTVKVLGIQVGVGERAQIVRPTPETIRNAMYPFAERLYLYVHPQASDTAKDFAHFLATGGASEQTLHTDPIKAMMDTFRGHGLIPLSEAAVVQALRSRE